MYWKKPVFEFFVKHLKRFRYLFNLWKIGYFQDQKGIRKRYVIEDGNWSSHLTACRSYIQEAMQNCRHTESVFILGSGWLLDLPLDQLSKKFRIVYLIDILHPSYIRRFIKQYPNVYIVEKDLTGGGIVEINRMIAHYQYYKQKIPVSSLALDALFVHSSPGFLVSLNVLSQLDEILATYLRKYRIYSEDELNSLRKTIQQHHLDLVLQHPSCLITDYEEVVLNKKNQEMARYPLLYTDVPRGEREEEWIWQFDTYGNYYPGRKTFRPVLAKSYPGVSNAHKMSFMNQNISRDA